MTYGTSANEGRRFSEFIGEMISLDDVISYIGSNFQPHQIFDQDTLETWAIDNDFVHIDDKS